MHWWYRRRRPLSVSSSVGATNNWIAQSGVDDLEPKYVSTIVCLWLCLVCVYLPFVPAFMLFASCHIAIVLLKHFSDSKTARSWLIRLKNKVQQEVARLTCWKLPICRSPKLILSSSNVQQSNLAEICYSSQAGLVFLPVAPEDARSFASL